MKNAKGIKTIIRLRKQALDDKRRLLAEAENQKEKLEGHLERLHEEFSKEQQLIGKIPALAYMFTGYAEHNKRKQEQTKAAIHSKNAEIKALEEDIRHLFSELKKYDIALEQMQQREALEAKHRETILLDELAQDNFRIQKEGE